MTAELLGTRFRFEAPAGLFSVDRIDDGTRLLLASLPDRPPAHVLDLGCGYGALGLPVAARYPEAHCLLVDRLVPAAEAARRNAEAHGLARVEARASLGYRDVPHTLRFDWILCNVPARIGDSALANFIDAGAERLAPGGELRLVVINDLGPVVERLASAPGRTLRAVGAGPRHRVFACAPVEPGAAPPPPADADAVYLRDSVTLGGRRFERPQDISDDPAHHAEALPLLLELLPRQRAGPALVWRGGYGVAAVALAAQGAPVVAADVDLLATAFTRRNATAHGVTVALREAAALAGALRPDERFSFLAGELSPSQDEASARRDLAASIDALAPGGHALWLGLSTRARIAEAAGAVPVARRGAFSAWRVQRRS